jgi:heme exporter protein C
MNILYALGNPKKFISLCDLILPYIIGITILTGSYGLWGALIQSPIDYQQGSFVRIMYIHVPASWMALSIYGMMAISNGVGLIWKHPLAFLGAKCLAPVGLCFTIVSLITGSIWGKPMWGTWWVWDARLTSMVILLFLYIGYMALEDAFDNPERGQKSSAILSVIGVVNLPIIKWSVDWWNTLHQPASLLRSGGPSIHPDMLIPLLSMGFWAFSFSILIMIIRMKSSLMSLKLDRNQI